MTVPVEQISPYALSIQEACRFSGLGRTRLYAAISSGELKTLKVGTRRLVPVAALEAWLASFESGETA